MFDGEFCIDCFGSASRRFRLAHGEMLGDCVPDWLGQPCELGYCVRERERERQESNHDQQILIERLQSGNNWDNCSTLEEGRTNRTRDGLKDTVLGKFQTQSEMQNKSEESNRRRGSSECNGVARLFQEILISKSIAFIWLFLFEHD